MLDLILRPPKCVPPDYEIRVFVLLQYITEGEWDGAMVQLDPVEIFN